jgi:dCMP deaminase
MEIAYKVAERATCDRAHVGCVLVKDNRIIATGYNGSLSGQEHCCDSGCLIIDDHCENVLHAEANALMACAKYGISTNGCCCYVTHHPCFHCLKLLISAGISKIYYEEGS